MTKLSIIIPCFNNVDLTRACVSSIFRNTSDFTLFLIDNGSTDETSNYFKYLVSAYDNIQIIHSNINLGFGPAVNLALSTVDSEYTCILNNDTLVTSCWSSRLIDSLNEFRFRRGDDSFCFIGPVSNNASGIQSVDFSPNDFNNLDSFSDQIYKDNRYKISFSHFLSGFCFLGFTSAFKEVGPFDENFKIGGYEDNDFFLRAALKGFKCCVDLSVFIFHHGQQTLNIFKNYQSDLFFKNCMYYVQKYSSPDLKKMCVLLRVKNGDRFLPTFLSNVKNFCHDIFVVDNDSSDTTLSILRSFPDLNIQIQSFNCFDESRDRQFLLDTAIKNGFDWALSLDVDEVMPDYVNFDFFQRLMHPVNPEIFSYSFNIFTFFESEKYIRQDSPWNYLIGIRFFRLLPNSKIDIHGKRGLHCSHSPSFSPVNTRHTKTPILHYGYISSDLRLSKHDFYNSIDDDPFQPNIGPFGYKHLTTSEVLLAEYRPNNSISLAVLTDDNCSKLYSLLYNHQSYFDEIHVLHTGKSKFIQSICAAFRANYYHKPFKNNFSYLRNYLKSKISTSWILFLDTDETILHSDFSQLSQMILRDVDGYLFIVWNFQPNGSVIFSDNVRLIKNTDKIYWSHPVHESVSESVRLNHLDIIPSPIPIRHSGFLEDQSIKSKKSKLYLSILRGENANHPSDPSVYFHLAFHYFENNDIQTGLSYLDKCISLDPRFFLAHKELGLRYCNMALDHLKSCLDSIPRGHYYFDYISRLYDYISGVNSIEFRG
jgi:GT2 family glycosyltransferase